MRTMADSLTVWGRQRQQQAQVPGDRASQRKQLPKRLIRAAGPRRDPGPSRAPRGPFSPPLLARPC